MSLSEFSVTERLEVFIRSWHPRLTKDFRQFLQWMPRISERRGRDSAKEHKQPYWLLLPRWLASVYGNDAGSKASDPRFVEDILWGQYCLFLCVKIHDDLYDRHTNRLSLLFAGDEFLLEAYRIFCLHFGTSSFFWDFFYSSLGETLRAVVALNNLQLGGNARRADVLKHYRKEYSLCKIGTYAVCLQAKRRKDFPRVAAFSDEMAIVGQIVDDLQDMATDLESGRLNYAASFFLAHGENRGRRNGQPLARIATTLLAADATAKLFSELQRRVAHAAEFIRPLRMRDASDYLDFYQESLSNLKAQFHQERVRHIFGALAVR